MANLLSEAHGPQVAQAGSSPVSEWIDRRMNGRLCTVVGFAKSRGRRRVLDSSGRPNTGNRSGLEQSGGCGVGYESRVVL